MTKTILWFTIILSFIFMTWCIDKISITEKSDHWKYQEEVSKSTYNRQWFSNNSWINPSSPWALYDTNTLQENIWFQVWADQDMMLFRDNIEKWHIPSLETITYNGIFSDYHFQQPSWECETMFCPLVDYWQVDNENWIQISLWSNIKDEDFQRPPTNFVLVIDKSWSMWWALSQYYYENTQDYIYESDLCDTQNELYFAPWKKCISQEDKQIFIDDYTEISKQSRMEFAMQAMSKMLDKLREDDRIWIVLYDDSAYIAHELIKVENIDKSSLKKHLKSVRDWGGTNMESWMKKWLSLFDDDMKSWYQNRVLFITDAMPNMWDYSAWWLANMVKDASEDNIYFSFFWVAVDFQQQFVQKIWKFEWNNYFYISDAWEFSQRIVDEFDYNFFPMIFNLKMNIDNEDNIEKVYWLDNHKNELMSINTLFPTPPKTEWHRWSIILLKLKEQIQENINIQVSYKEYTGKEVETSQEIKIDNKPANTSMIKWVNLVKYTDALKESIQERDISILENIKEKLKLKEEIFQWDDKKVFEKEIKTIDKLIKLINNWEQVKQDYNPDRNKRNLEK